MRAGSNIYLSHLGDHGYHDDLQTTSSIGIYGSVDQCMTLFLFSFVGHLLALVACRAVVHKLMNRLCSALIPAPPTRAIHGVFRSTALAPSPLHEPKPLLKCGPAPPFPDRDPRVVNTESKTTH